MQHPSTIGQKEYRIWLEKIERNRARDRRVCDHLIEIGWTILRFWEHETVEAIVEKIASTIEECRIPKRSLCSSARSFQNVKRTSGQFEAVDGDVVSIEFQTIE